MKMAESEFLAYLRAAPASRRGVGQRWREP
jgi:hypothetical protein